MAKTTYGYNCENELQFIQAYLQHAATLLNRDELRDWTIERTAVQDMERQADSVSCGIYVCMFVDCLTTGTPRESPYSRGNQQL